MADGLAGNPQRLKRAATGAEKDKGRTISQENCQGVLLLFWTPVEITEGVLKRGIRGIDVSPTASGR